MSNRHYNSIYNEYTFITDRDVFWPFYEFMSQIESSSAHYVQGLKDQKYAFC